MVARLRGSELESSIELRANDLALLGRQRSNHSDPCGPIDRSHPGAFGKDPSPAVRTKGVVPQPIKSRSAFERARQVDRRAGEIKRAASTRTRVQQRASSAAKQVAHDVADGIERCRQHITQTTTGHAGRREQPGQGPAAA